MVPALFSAVCLQAQEAASVFPPPPKPFEAQVAEEGHRREIRFPSALTSGWEKNDQVHAVLVLPREAVKPMPLVILLHGLGVMDHSLEEQIAKRLNERGIAALLVTLPFHIERTPQGYRSGALALRPDPDALKETLYQSISDVRRALDWAGEQSYVDQSRIGVLGVSLGGIIASLLMAVEPRFSCGAFLLAGADLAHIVWNSSLTISLREALRRKGWTENKLREYWKPVEPSTYLNSELGERVLLVGAMFDTVVPAVDTEKLHRALGSPPMLWLETGHYGAVLVQRRLLRVVGDFFAAKFSGRTFICPRSIGAPTVRLGLMLDEPSGLQVAAGLDFWRSNARGDFFVSGLLTTRGPAVFGGWRGPLGFSVGLFAHPRRTVPGLLWYFVL